MEIIKKWFSSHKKSIFYTLLFWMTFMFFWESTFAADSPEAAMKELVSTVVMVTNWVVLIASTVVSIISFLVSIFLTPWWVNGTIFWFESYLRSIRILVSNIVYLAFAFILIGIAFMNIIGQWTNKYALKSALPRFVIGVLMVPFSWFFVQFVLAISAFLTVQVLGLPYDLLGDEHFPKDLKDRKICTKYRLTTFSEITTDISQQFKNCKDEGSGEDIKEILKWSVWTAWNISGMMNIYTFAIMRVHERKYVDMHAIAAWANNMGNLTIKVLMDTIFLIIFLVIMVALFIALFVRWIVLWVHIMFSPLYGLLYFMWKAKGTWGVKDFSITSFISLAMVPVYVSAALAFGLIFIFVASEWLWKAPENWLAGSIFSKNAAGDSVMNAGWFELTIAGAMWNWVDDEKRITGWIFYGKWNALGQIIIELFSFVLLRVAVMAALKQSDITAKVTEPIKSFWDQVWGIIAKSPTYIPIIPWGKKGKDGVKRPAMSASSLKAFSQSSLQAIERKYSWINEASKFGRELFWESPLQAALDNFSNSSKDFTKMFTAQDARDTKGLIKYMNNDISNEKFHSIIEQLNSHWWLTKDGYERMKNMNVSNIQDPNFYKIFNESLATEVKTVFEITDDTWEKLKEIMHDSWDKIKKETTAAKTANVLYNNNNNTFRIEKESGWELKFIAKKSWKDKDITNNISKYIDANGEYNNNNNGQPYTAAEIVNELGIKQEDVNNIKEKIEAKAKAAKATKK